MKGPGGNRAAGRGRPCPRLGVRPCLCTFVASQSHLESGTSEMLVKCPLLLRVLRSPSSPCQGTKEASGPGHLQTGTGRYAKSWEAARRRDGPHSGWQTVPGLEGPGGGRRGEARCGDACPVESPGPPVPVPALFYAYCHPAGSQLRMADAKALTAPGTKPRCEMQPRGSARPGGRTRSGPEAGSGDETSLAPDPGLQLEGPEGPTWATAELGCLPDAPRALLPTTRGMTPRGRVCSFFAEETGKKAGWQEAMCFESHREDAFQSTCELGPV